MAGLYAHIPFCHSKCAYCDFYSTPSLQRLEELVTALSEEFDLRRSEVDWSAAASTVYFGGGTPSIVPAEMLKPLADNILATTGAPAEFTIEANPEDITTQKVKAWREMGINRVSMGVQSLCDAELQIIGRRHTAQDAIDAVSKIRDGGIDSISLDLIYGLPAQDVKSWESSLARLLSLEPQHVSAYMLSYEPGTRLYAMRKTGKIQEADEDTLSSMYRLLCQTTRQAGYAHYEISNFALAGYAVKHNSSYWDGTPYLGLGPSAHSYDGAVRRINPSNINRYIQLITDGNAACEIDEENDDNRFNDMLITALRTVNGLNLSALHDWRRRQLIRDAAPYIQAGALTRDGDALRFTEEAWLISDSILSSLVQI